MATRSTASCCSPGCDKTTPAMVMGAASVDLPAIMLTGGPMLTGRHEGRRLGSATDMWRMSEAVRAGTLSEEAFLATESVHDPQRRALQPDGDGVDDGVDGRGARPDVARQRGDPCPRRPPPPSRPPHRTAHRRDGARRPPARPRCSPGRRSRTPSGCSPPSADRPTRSSTSWRSPDGSASSSPSTTSTGSARTCRCSPT